MTESSREVGGHPSTRDGRCRPVSIHRTFVVRLYAGEVGLGGRDGCRAGEPDPLAGRVEHVPTREEAGFSTVEELVTFFRRPDLAPRGDGR